jgi:hypothetical protein
MNLWPNEEAQTEELMERRVFLGPRNTEQSLSSEGFKHRSIVTKLVLCSLFRDIHQTHFRFLTCPFTLRCTLLLA